MKKSLNKYIVIFITFLSSCNFYSSDKVYTTDECDTLSLSCFKGKPNDCYELKTSCEKIEYRFTKDICQEAFNKLMLGLKKDQLQQGYGDRIIECFTEDQTKKYL